jgi:predicted RNA-binding Zn-ribbon protein involved in translation (DUF1610 family)
MCDEKWEGVNAWRCPKCGSLLLAEDAQPDENDIIGCEECGFEGDIK